jgi:uncharacterized protein (TIGR04255 family)
MSTPVKYDNPPVVEVVCGVMFSGTPVQTVHIGAYWDRVRAEFPKVEDAAPLSPVVEEDGQPVALFEWSTLPPARRAWLYNADGSHLLQIQEDRFLFNWKHTLGANGYPSYKFVFAEFEKHLQAFVNFMRNECGRDLTYRQFEMTYVNHITKENGLTPGAESALLIDHVVQGGARFLPEVENFNFSKSYRLPNGSGRLHIVAQTASRAPGNERMVRLDLVARGIPANFGETNDGDLARKKWFDVAHEWITHGFADVTSLDIQKNIWKRTS